MLKQSKNRWWALLTLPLTLMGCGTNHGFLRDSMTQTQVRGPGFRIVKTGLTASADTGSLFCSIPTDEGQIYRRTMELLNAEAKLLPNQMLVNLREDVKLTAFLVFYCKQVLTLSADIIEFSASGYRTAAADAPGRASETPPVASSAPVAAPAPAASQPASPSAPPLPAGTVPPRPSH